MYLLTIKDGLGTRHIGPYASPKHASDDLDRVLETCSERARWQFMHWKPQTAPSNCRLLLPDWLFRTDWLF